MGHDIHHSYSARAQACQRQVCGPPEGACLQQVRLHEVHQEGSEVFSQVVYDGWTMPSPTVGLGISKDFGDKISVIYIAPVVTFFNPEHSKSARIAWTSCAPPRAAASGAGVSRLQGPGAPGARRHQRAVALEPWSPLAPHRPRERLRLEPPSRVRIPPGEKRLWIMAGERCGSVDEEGYEVSGTT